MSRRYGKSYSAPTCTGSKYSPSSMNWSPARRPRTGCRCGFIRTQTYLTSPSTLPAKKASKMSGMRTMRQRRRGFTLIELLIVISIILVILAIAVPKMNKQMQGAREMAVIREIGSIHQAETQYYSQFGKYATNLVQLGPPVSGADSPEAANIIPKVPADGKKNGYIYTLAATAGG